MDDNCKPQATGDACRMNAKGVLEDKIKRQRRKLESLVILLEAIPWETLDAEQEERLWSFFISKD